MAQADPSLFPGVPSYDLPYLKMCGMTIISLCTDIVIDLFEPELRAQFDRDGETEVKTKIFQKLYPLPFNKNDSTVNY